MKDAKAFSFNFTRHIFISIIFSLSLSLANNRTLKKVLVATYKSINFPIFFTISSSHKIAICTYVSFLVHSVNLNIECGH